MREHGVDSVDLVKVDVEGSEMEVLEGIADEDWPRLRQPVIEVHDFGRPAGADRDAPRGARVRRRSQQEEWATLLLLGLHNVYAIRPSPAP
jgi:phthiocerol/phenolphthiocerol synthesis type-I polyketide synthase E